MTDVLAPTLSGRFVRLDPLMSYDLDAIHEIVNKGENWWRYGNGIKVPREHLPLALDAQQQVVVRGLNTDRILGLLTIYDLDPQSMTVKIAAVKDPDAGLPFIEAFPLYFDRLFAAGTRKMYFVVPEYNEDQFLGGAQRLLDGGLVEEGRLKFHTRPLGGPLANGRYWDLVTYALYRETWLMSDYSNGKYLKENTPCT